jgi:glycogen debranching enzyme
MDTDGNPRGDGFLASGRRLTSGMRSQGWSDAFDASFHAAGRLAEPTIASCAAMKTRR